MRCITYFFLDYWDPTLYEPNLNLTQGFYLPSDNVSTDINFVNSTQFPLDQNQLGNK